MAINSRTKGKVGELEAARFFSEYGYNTRRGQQYNGADGSADVVGLNGIHLEIKRVERLNLSDAMQQSIHDARDGEIPVVMHRKNHEPWYITMQAEKWVELYREWQSGGGI